MVKLDERIQQAKMEKAEAIHQIQQKSSKTI